MKLIPVGLGSNFFENRWLTDKNNDNINDDFDYNFFKLMKNPKFEDIIKNYIYFKHPEWLLSGTRYYGNTPNTSNTPNTPNNQNNPQQFYSKEYFGYSGNKYTTTLCMDIKNYIIFFIISITIYLLLTLFLKRK